MPSVPITTQAQTVCAKSIIGDLCGFHKQVGHIIIQFLNILEGGTRRKHPVNDWKTVHVIYIFKVCFGCIDDFFRVGMGNGGE